MAYLLRDYTKRIYAGHYEPKDLIISEGKREYITCDRNGNIYCTAGSVIFKLTPTKNKDTFRKYLDMTSVGCLLRYLTYIPRNRALVAVRCYGESWNQRAICLNVDSSDDDFNKVAQQIKRINKQNKKFHQVLIAIRGEFIVCSRQQKISHKVLSIKYKNTYSHTITVERLGGVFHRRINVGYCEHCCAVSKNGLYIATYIIPKKTKENAIEHTINLYCGGKRSFIIIGNSDYCHFFSSSILTNDGNYIFYNPLTKRIVCRAYRSGKCYALMECDVVVAMKLVPSTTLQEQHLIISTENGGTRAIELCKANGKIVITANKITSPDNFYCTHGIEYFKNGDFAVLQEAAGNRGVVGIYRFDSLPNTMFFKSSNAEKRSDNDDRHEKIPQNFVDTIIKCEL